eukprot:UN07327
MMTNPTSYKPELWKYNTTLAFQCTATLPTTPFLTPAHAKDYPYIISFTKSRIMTGTTSTGTNTEYLYNKFSKSLELQPITLSDATDLDQQKLIITCSC